jgi:NADH-quinone oxidoreductase subunit J
MEFFSVFSTGAWLCSILTVRSKNPVHSVFYRIRVFLNVSGLLFRMGREFFARIQILVYVGALAIMFLFVVMLLDISVTEIVAHQRGTYAGASMLAAAFFLRIWLCFDQSSVFEQSLWPIWNSIGTNEFSFSMASNHGLNDTASRFSSSLGITMNQLGPEANSLTVLSKARYDIHVDLTILASLILRVAMVGAIVLTRRQRVNVPFHDVFTQHQREFLDIVQLTK